MNITKKNLALALLTSLAAVGCASTSDTAADAAGAAQEESVDLSAPIMIADAEFLAKSANEHTRYEVMGDSITVVFDKITQAQASSKWPNMKFRPVAGIYDWSQYKGLKLTLENKGAAEARIEMKVADNIGIMGAATHQLDLPIYLPAGQTTEVEFLFNGQKMGLEGYRGGEQLDLTQIPEFQFYAVGPIAEQTISVHAIDYIK